MVRIKTYEGFAEGFLKHQKEKYSIINSIIDSIKNNEFVKESFRDRITNTLLRELDDLAFTSDELILLEKLEKDEANEDDIEKLTSDEFINKFMEFQNRTQKIITDLNLKFEKDYDPADILDIEI